MMRSVPYPGTQTVLRAIALLKSFTDARPEWGLTALARESSLNKTTVYRLLTALESEGMVVRLPKTDVYRLGPTVIVLGSVALRSNDLRSASRAELERLAQLTRETATLEVLSDGEVLVLDEVAGSHLLSVSSAIGTTWAVHATSTGKTLLAYLPEADVETMLQSPLTRFTDKTLTTPAELRRALEGVRGQGFAVAIEELEEGFVDLSAPVRNHDGRVVAAVSLSGPTTRLTDARIPGMAELVMEAAHRISQWLGYTAR
jgi:IclR family acetate operon transcriptional repressor